MWIWSQGTVWPERHLLGPFGQIQSVTIGSTGRTFANWPIRALVCIVFIIIWAILRFDCQALPDLMAVLICVPVQTRNPICPSSDELNLKFALTLSHCSRLGSFLFPLSLTAFHSRQSASHPSDNLFVHCPIPSSSQFGATQFTPGFILGASTLGSTRADSGVMIYSRAKWLSQVTLLYTRYFSTTLLVFSVVCHCRLFQVIVLHPFCRECARCIL